VGTLHFRPLRCERARRWASLGLDGELSELERAMLGRHLESCPDCARFAEETRALTGALRAAPALAPTRPLAPAARAQRRLPAPFMRVAAVAAAVVGAIGLAGGAERAGGPTTGRGGPEVAAHTGLDTDDQIRDLRMRELRASVDELTLRRDFLLPL
jgi:anti-sigma factor RsiW